MLVAVAFFVALGFGLVAPALPLFARNFGVGKAAAGLVLRLRVTNTGGRAGTAVPQAYLGAPATAPPGAAFARRALAAYTRVSLRPGQSRMVTLTVPQRQLLYWQDARGWVTAPGKRWVYVGGDERASALSATVTIPR